MRDLLDNIGYRLLWKALEVVTILLLFLILDTEAFTRGFLTLIIIQAFMFVFNTTYHSDNADEMRKFYNSLSFIAPIVGLALSIGFFIFGSVEFKIASWILFLHSLSVAPETFLVRRKSVLLVKTQLTAQSVMFLSSFLFAVSGFGYLSIIYGTLLYHIIKAVVLWMRFPIRPTPVLHTQMIINIFSYLKEHIVGILALQTIMFLPLVLAGWTGSFPSFFIAYTLGFFVYENLTVYLNSLVIPSFLEMEGQEVINYNTVRYIEYLAFIVVPFSAMFIMLSRELASILGIQLDILVALVLAGALKGVFHGARVLLLASGNIKVLRTIRLLEMAVLLLATAILFSFGGVGIAFAVLIAAVVSALLYTLFVWKTTQMDLLVLSRDYFYIVVGGVLSALTLGLLKEIVVPRGFFSFTIVALCGILAYGLTTFFFNRELYRRFIRFLFSTID